jgi:uncharacterized protein (DUF1330 family)
MLPVIRPNDIVTIVSCKTYNLAAGDIAVFTHPKTQKTLVHRIVEKRGDRFIFKGDNIVRADGFVCQNAIFGIVANVSRKNQNVFWGVKKARKIMAFLSRFNMMKAGLFFADITLGTIIAFKIIDSIENWYQKRSN